MYGIVVDGVVHVEGQPSEVKAFLGTIDGTGMEVRASMSLGQLQDSVYFSEYADYLDTQQAVYTERGVYLVPQSFAD